MVKNLRWQKADQFSIYKCSQGVEPETIYTMEQIQLVVREGLELSITSFQVQCPHTAQPHCLLNDKIDY